MVPISIIYRRTFIRVVALVYTAGTAAHILRLLFDPGLDDLPFALDWILIVLGSYGGVGLVLFTRQIDYRGIWEKIVHALITVHLLVSVAVHGWIVSVHSHDVLSIFPYGYSYLAVGYFGLFAWRSWTMRLSGSS